LEKIGLGVPPRSEAKRRLIRRGERGMPFTLKAERAGRVGHPAHQWSVLNGKNGVRGQD